MCTDQILNYMNTKILGVLLGSAVLFACEKGALEQTTNKPNSLSNAVDAANVTAAAAPAVGTYTPTNSYINSGFNFLHLASVNKNRTAIGGDAYTNVYGFNVPEENRVRGIRWDVGDEETAYWRPQGLAGFTKNGVRYLIVSWYGQGTYESKGSRISIIDISPSSSTYLTYRHVLLVQPNLPTGTTNYTQYGTYAPLEVHAGGMAVHQDKLYIASTNLGMRIFDLSKVIEVTTGTGTDEKCGKDANGNLYAFNYRYIMPQVATQKINNASPFSSVQINFEKNELWTCQYIASSEAATVVPKIFGFPINASGDFLQTTVKTVIPQNSLFTDSHAHGMQGIFRKGNKTWLSSTGSPSLSYGSNARLARYTDGADDTVRFRWPYGAEALYYEESLDYLWSLTEYEPNAPGKANGSQPNRCIFAVDFSKYQ